MPLVPAVASWNTAITTVLKNIDVNVVVLVPKIPYIVKELVRKIKTALGL